MDYIGVQPSKHATFVPHTAGRYSVKRFRKAQCPIVERLTNSLMMHGRNNGKKLMAVRIVKHAMEIIHLLSDLNPIQVIIDAIVNRYIKIAILKPVKFLRACYYELNLIKKVCSLCELVVHVKMLPGLDLLVWLGGRLLISLL